MTFYPVNFPFFLWKKKLSLPLEGGASPNILTCISPGRPPSTRTLPRLVHLMFPTGTARVFGCCPARARRPMRIPFPVTPHGATEKRSAPLLRRACRKFSHARSLAPSPPPPPLSLSAHIIFFDLFSSFTALSTGDESRLVLVLWVGLGKKYVTKTWMREIFLQSHILSTAGQRCSK
jgi:hypothetical protein